MSDFAIPTCSSLTIIRSITSFGDRSNDYETVVQYFRAHFLQVHRKNNENRRVLYTHFTSVVVSAVAQEYTITCSSDYGSLLLLGHQSDSAHHWKRWVIAL